MVMSPMADLHQMIVGVVGATSMCPRVVVVAALTGMMSTPSVSPTCQPMPLTKMSVPSSSLVVGGSGRHGLVEYK